jgi:hypothetical protein
MSYELTTNGQQLFILNLFIEDYDALNCPAANIYPKVAEEGASEAVCGSSVRDSTNLIISPHCINYHPTKLK